MKRSKLLSLVVVVCLVSSLFLAACGGSQQKPASSQPASSASSQPAPQSASSDKKIVLSYANVLPADHAYAKSAARINQKLMEKSGGRLGIQYFPGGQLGSEKDNVDSVVAGSLDICLTSPGEIGKRYDKFLMLDAPYVFNNAEHAMKVLNGDGAAKLFDGLRQKAGLVNLTNLLLGTRQLTTVKKPVKTPADIKDLKIRVPDTPISVAYIKAMGAKPTPMAITEVYLALQQGVVEGAENPISQILSNKFNEVQKYISLTRHVVQTNQLVMNEKKFNSLPDDLKKILLDVFKEEGDICVKEVLDYEKTIEAKLPSYGFEVINPDLEAFRKTTVDNFKTNSIWNEEVYQMIQSAK